MLYIPAEDLLPQRKHTGSWAEDKAYLTVEKYMDNSRKVGYYFVFVPTPYMLFLRQ
jgi:hypothetical protein